MKLVCPGRVDLGRQATLEAQEQEIADAAERVGLLERVSPHVLDTPPASVDGQRGEHLAHRGDVLVDPRGEHVAVRRRARICAQGVVQLADGGRRGHDATAYDPRARASHRIRRAARAVESASGAIGWHRRG